MPIAVVHGLEFDFEQAIRPLLAFLFVFLVNKVTHSIQLVYKICHQLSLYKSVLTFYKRFESSITLHTIPLLTLQKKTFVNKEKIKLTNKK